MADRKQSQALSVRLWLGCLATQEMLCNYLGVRLGLYDALAAGTPLNASQLATRAGVAPRYAREWLEQQAVSGIVKVVASGDADARLYLLPEEHREVLTESDSPLSRVAGMLPLGAVAHALPGLLEAYRSGAGLPDRAYGPDWRYGHGASNRALYTHGLAAWVRDALPDVHTRLGQPGARAADVACGAGWAALALARAYPTLRVDGFEIDPDFASDARANVAEAGLGERVSIHVRDACQPGLAAEHALVCLFDTLHEVPRPVELLQGCRTLAGASGTVLVMDALVGETFAAPANEVERFQYTTSVLHCLPVGLAEPGSVATGTALRPTELRRLASAAGFSGVELLRVDDRFHRFYRLRP
jgi:SAM-dependent methyltransferase